MWTRLKTHLTSALQSLAGQPDSQLALSLRQAATILFGAAGLTFVLLNLDFNLLEANLYDMRMARGIQASADPGIALVTLDDASTKELDELAPLPLDMHAKLVESLEKLQPRAVGYLIDLNEVINRVNPDLIRTPWAARFVDACTRMEARGIPFMLGTPYDVTGEVVPPFPLSGLPHSIARIHNDGNVFAEDKVTRRALTRLNNKPVFHMEFAQKLGLVPKDSRPAGNYRLPEADAEFFFFRYHGDTSLNPRHPDGLPYQRVSFLDVLKGNEAAKSLKGKIVLVGTLSKDDSGDFAFTPYSKNGFVNPKLVVHANILDSIIHDDGLVRAPAWANWLATFAATGFVLWWVLNSTPLYGVFATISLIVGVLATGQLFFQWKDLWIRESQPLVGIFVGYYLVVPYRLIREYKKRWDYQKKNEILTQVEEMKTNFMYLVTHDLKTPVARIQGLAEVLLRKAHERLIDRDRETLGNIVQATDELNHFITSILELSKVESNRLQLYFESKDINQLIERSVDGFKAQSRVRGVGLELALDPLFPVRIDAGLISKVINNLIDNAMKYSPKGSRVQIASREEGEWIFISVTDQGIGMSEEELKNLFTRFYRAKNDSTTQITGTGLGLYLTKYFIEAHGGTAQVQSTPGKGSTFTIRLPVAGSASSPQSQGSRSGLTSKISVPVEAVPVVKENTDA
jgi:signal transduction histidine kinase